MDRHQIAAVFEEMAALLEIADANPFRVRAYANAARIIEDLADFEARVTAGTLTDVKGIGQGLAAHIHELLTSGTIAELEQLHRTIPPGVVAMTAIPGVGPKKAKLFWKTLKLTTIDQLAAACAVHTVAGLPGMGAKSEEKILLGIDYLRQQHNQHLFLAAWAVAQQLVTALHEHPSVQRLEVAGSLRRRKEVVKDIDLVASSRDPAALMDAFVHWDGVQRVIAHGGTKSSVLTAAGMNCDLRVVSDTEFPYALHHFTGSKEHNTALRSRAQQMGMKMNEYGLFRFTKSGERLIACKTEADIFARLGLDAIEPELRENMGEIEAAAQHTLPALVARNDLRGVFHCHSTYSDGKNTIEEMALAAKQRGLAYIGMSDHSQSAAYAGGLSPARVAAQAKEIAALNRTVRGITILRGIEADILKDGALDYHDALLAQLDFVIASVHSNLGLSRADMTARVCRALAHPAVRILAHPTGRLLLSRKAYEIDMDEVLRVAGQHRVAVEINCNPKRSELDWRLGRRARECGVVTAISPDAHTTGGLDYLEYGIGLARKGWWTAKDIINAWPLEKVNAWLHRKPPTRKNGARKKSQRS